MLLTGDWNDRYYSCSRRRPGFIEASWVVLFASKFAILEAIDLVFGDKVEFGGVIPFIVVVIAVIAAEAIIKTIYEQLGHDQSS